MSKENRTTLMECAKSEWRRMIYNGMTWKAAREEIEKDYEFTDEEKVEFKLWQSEVMEEVSYKKISRYEISLLITVSYRELESLENVVAFLKRSAHGSEREINSKVKEVEGLKEIIKKLQVWKENY